MTTRRSPARPRRLRAGRDHLRGASSSPASTGSTSREPRSEPGCSWTATGRWTRRVPSTTSCKPDATAGRFTGFRSGSRTSSTWQACPPHAAIRWEGSTDRDRRAIVARLREAGAIILGKTVTTPFAWIDPPVTRNPWNLERTPGGSSSGSAAAVACGMCLGATRHADRRLDHPARVVLRRRRYEADLRAREHQGILPFAPSLDHPGSDRPMRWPTCGLMFEAMPRARIARRRVCPVGASCRRPSSPGPARTAIFDRRATPEMAARIRTRPSGAWVTRVPRLRDVGERLRLRGDPPRSIASSWRPRPPSSTGSGSPRCRKPTRPGSPSSFAKECHPRPRPARPRAPVEGSPGQAMRCCSTRLDALVTPATVGAAPDPSTTGDPAFNSPWSYLGFPRSRFRSACRRTACPWLSS